MSWPVAPDQVRLTEPPKPLGSFSWLIAERVIRLSVGLVVGFLVARHLGPVNMGLYGYCAAVVGFLQFIPELGLDLITRRSLIEGKDDQREVISTVIMLRLAAALLSFFGLLIFALTFSVTSDERNMLIIFGLVLFQPLPLIASSWLLARLDARFVVQAQVAALTLGSTVRLFLVWRGADVVAFAAAFSGEVLLSGALIWLAGWRRGMRATLMGWRWPLAGRFLREGWPLAVGAFAAAVTLKTDVVMLKLMGGEYHSGIYVAATRISEVGYGVAIALAASIMPGLTRAFQSGDKSYTAATCLLYGGFAWLAFAFAIPVSLASSWIIRIAYGEPFAASAAVLSIHVWAGLFFFSGVARELCLVSERRTGFIVLAGFSGAVSNIVLNAILIPIWMESGAAIATMISFATAGWLSSFLISGTRRHGRAQLKGLMAPLLGWSELGVLIRLIQRQIGWPAR